MQKLPKVQTGSPSLLSPHSYYLYYHQRAGLQDAKKGVPKKTSRYDRFSRVIEIYNEISKKIIDDLKPQYIHEDEKLNQYIKVLKSRLDNKIRVSPDGKKFIMINDSIKFEATDEQYEELFQSGKLPFSNVIREIAKELIATVHDNAPAEQDKAMIIGPTGRVETKKPIETIAVDLDNTLIDNYEDPIEGAKEALQILKNKGFRIIIYTARFSYLDPSEWQNLVDYIDGILKKYEIPFDEISVTKPSCKLYIDDRAVKFTNWNDVIKSLDIEETAATAACGTGPQTPNKEKDKTPPGLGMLEEIVELEQYVEDIPKSKSFQLLTN